MGRRGRRELIFEPFGHHFGAKINHKSEHRSVVGRERDLEGFCLSFFLTESDMVFICIFEVAGRSVGSTASWKNHGFTMVKPQFLMIRGVDKATNI